MYERKSISVGNILLDLSNYRHGVAGNQKAARDAIIAERGRKLSVLAKDIAENGLNPFDTPLVISADDGNNNYVVIEGNRRITAINLMMKPDLPEWTPVHAAFKRLNKRYPDSILKIIDCVVAQTSSLAFSGSTVSTPMALMGQELSRGHLSQKPEPMRSRENHDQI